MTSRRSRRAIPAGSRAVARTRSWAGHSAARAPKIGAKGRVGGGRTKQHEHLGLDRGDLGVQPRTAGIDLGRVGLLMQPPLALRFPFEVLYSIRDIDLSAV